MHETSPLCPCCSSKSYADCCKKFHDGATCENALQLMRSRYSAYALKKSSYIIKTTHPKSSHFQKDIKKWEKEILSFCNNTVFQKLDILEFIDGDEKAYVTFRAHLSQNKKDVSFTEKSLFEKILDVWFYKEGYFL